MRPRNLSEFVGQGHVVGEGAVIRLAVEKDRIFSMILWGPPGCGKTTLARIIAGETRSHFAHFSAVLSGVKEIRAVIDDARQQLSLRRRRRYCSSTKSTASTRPSRTLSCITSKAA